MLLRDVKEWLEADVMCGADRLEEDLDGVFASDFMSDILAFTDSQKILITGMVNPQVVRTAEMVDIQCIVFVRGKTPTDEIIALARIGGVTLWK